VIDETESVVTVRVTGARAAETFRNESGGHRWQRVPRTEKRGRVQTSTVTVAVLDEATETQVTLLDRDLEWKAIRGSGAGGQARNKTSNAVQLWHKPTGTMVRCESERSQDQNLRNAKAMLRARLLQQRSGAATSAEAAARRAQLGSGQRGDKVRTIRVQDGQVHCHVTGRRWQYKAYLRGDW
jgi:peptide chain release factor 1